MVWALCGGVNCPSGGGRRLRPSGSAVVTVCNNYVCVCVSILPRTDLRFPNRDKKQVQFQEYISVFLHEKEMLLWA